MVAEFESDLIRARTREGMQVAKAKGRLRGKQPKLSILQQHHLMEVHNGGTHTTAELAELFNVARSTRAARDSRMTSTSIHPGGEGAAAFGKPWLSGDLRMHHSALFESSPR
jgi:DNA invertase Pin-like site-specific DNA recombinase